MERGLLSSNVISKHSLDIFARKHLQITSDFLDVAPAHPRRVHKTGLPVSLNLEGHSFATQGFRRPTVNHFRPSELASSLSQFALSGYRELPVAVEFTRPAPGFWRIAYPPTDWTA